MILPQIYRFIRELVYQISSEFLGVL